MRAIARMPLALKTRASTCWNSKRLLASVTGQSISNSSPSGRVRFTVAGVVPTPNQGAGRLRPVDFARSAIEDRQIGRSRDNTQNGTRRSSAGSRPLNLALAARRELRRSGDDRLTFRVYELPIGGLEGGIGSEVVPPDGGGGAGRPPNRLSRSRYTSRSPERYGGFRFPPRCRG